MILTFLFNQEKKVIRNDNYVAFNFNKPLSKQQKTQNGLGERGQINYQIQRGGELMQECTAIKNHLSYFLQKNKLLQKFTIEMQKIFVQFRQSENDDKQQ
ncbi:hypothetical protein TTHERM_00554430 (macronuclear) [Tetrahymena thermophila SB210]|uniref:Uncharacterized protein n=1 Tax=Tetrahymena thermophila (strain SB210) TaxID=312017 RepID=Q22UI2_TETTS|nr:hypothetical protein TTHERM_00554430 [Tetrahymena thermophila SB210]EAR88988.1 hypothetical protein TTHERM_00554430 [Tetrahymena thermophila SB210]|eukprot:XP_001009233.1 hypothetical protein TTHERM_00554430 [Tetrahymena thermophila SB210]